jgi:hypothetical protein
MAVVTQTVEVRERPILFSGPMVKAILEGKKTQTRRVVKLDKYSGWEVRPNSEGICILDGRGASTWLECPYGKPGDQLWVRETWAIADIYDKDSGNQGQMPFELNHGTRGISIWYRAGGEKAYKFATRGRWRPSIFMPRAASRITLEVTDIRVEQLQDITEEDAIAEGIEPLYSKENIQTTVGLESYRFGEPVPWTNYLWHGRPGGTEGYSSADNAVDSYRSLWDSINGKKCPWSSNPWVWVVEFRRVEDA